MYIKDSNIYKSIPEGYKQIFQNKFRNNISKHQVLNLVTDKKLSNRDIAIAEFLFNFKFATANNIYDFLKINNILTLKKYKEGEEEKETSFISIKSRLDKLVQYGILNKFTLSKIDELKNEADALNIYCLDLGGKFLLTNYSNQDTVNWQTSINLNSSENVGKELFITNFYLKLLDVCNVVYFETHPLRKADKINLSPSFEFAIESNGVKNYFLGEVTRQFDIPILFSKRIEKLDRLLSTNSWKKYYLDSQVVPTLFIFTETDELAVDASRLVFNTTNLEKVRFGTDERIFNNLSTGFLKYMPEHKKLKIIKLKYFEK
ncbi:hypothetical protein NBN67_18930 [Clostridioides difficile]|uniref:hypothetical protein n=1 Tax=Clostridioides difficile TaxID=1496 RepID=UPI0020303C4B|nr:hypothetical protein [Clostridioides difficile]MCM0739611.1 hypothetical protein [Clostridioides difficile]HBF2930723.1 hypothetical protein [Clostridioides difficile]HBF2935708.1 hypothetical protein [Clostridioides difficile]HBZ0282903.1 hypothetical protein [Clostridioides difficile]